MTVISGRGRGGTKTLQQKNGQKGKKEEKKKRKRKDKERKKRMKRRKKRRDKGRKKKRKDKERKKLTQGKNYDKKAGPQSRLPEHNNNDNTNYNNNSNNNNNNTRTKGHTSTAETEQCSLLPMGATYFICTKCHPVIIALTKLMYIHLAFSNCVTENFSKFESKDEWNSFYQRDDYQR